MKIIKLFTKKKVIFYITQTEILLIKIIIKPMLDINFCIDMQWIYLGPFYFIVKSYFLTKKI